QSSFSHLTKIPSVLTVRSSGGARAPILSVSRLNQAIGWSFYAAKPGVSKIRSQLRQIHIAARKQNADAIAREIELAMKDRRRRGRSRRLDENFHTFEYEPDG